MAVSIREDQFDPYAELSKFETGLAAGSIGAVATFVGTMRNFNDGNAVKHMTLEHYPGMTEKQLDTIITRAHEQWKLDDALIIHRVGDILPGEPIVLTAVWSAHRADAFEACRFLMEALKTDATFWKKETLADDSTRWVEKNTPGYTA